ncbi:MAG: 23S rRNA (uracil(1939)-C(5))-methyltransferase RlmD [Lachnospiraceae bacterium]|nr:23S rRNA (uracil(1939)-C(5))-methyltransferase RlmD [Lachnospiraceae bacterium]
MQKNELVKVYISDMGNEGEGIGKSDGLTLFVKGAVKGDTVIARILKPKKTYAYAKVEEIVTPSEDRVQPSCSLFGRCGGCNMQNMSYSAQLKMKADKVKNCLMRIGGIEEERLNACSEEIIGMEVPFRYRNKAQYPVGKGKDGKICAGFYAYHSHNIINGDDCVLQKELSARLVTCVKEEMEKKGLSAYNEETGKGLVRHVLTRIGFTTHEVMVCLVINAKDLKAAADLVPALETVINEYNKETCEERLYVLKSLTLNINTENTNVILGEKIIPVYGDTFITDYIGDVKFRISPLSFFQVNPVQTVKLYGKALEYAELTGKENVWDLYCGIGTISLFLAKSAARVCGVEIVPQAIEDAKENARLNGIDNADFFVGAAEDLMSEKYKESEGKLRAEVICLDPPRKGCEESLLETVVKMQPKRVVYVSCDPATLARDVKYFEKHGYELKKYTPVDMFPQTVHVETVVYLSQLS